MDLNPRDASCPSTRADEKNPIRIANHFPRHVDQIRAAKMILCQSLTRACNIDLGDTTVARVIAHAAIRECRFEGSTAMIRKMTVSWDWQHFLPTNLKGKVMIYTIKDNHILIPISRTQIIDIAINDTLKADGFPGAEHTWTKHDRELIEGNPDDEIFLQIDKTDDNKFKASGILLNSYQNS
jgi:hypothetical protein